MHVFITGGTGLVGSAVVAELIAHDHAVTVLARSEASAQAVVDARRNAAARRAGATSTPSAPAPKRPTA